jgi:ADP-ribosylglycohydrolase
MYIAQFIPDFLVLVNTLFETVGSVAEKAIEKDQANTKAIIDELNAIQSSLAVLTKREDLSSGELMHVCDLLIEVARIHERMNNRNKEHKERRLEYIGEIIGKGLAVIGTIVVAILANKSNKSDYEG